MTPPTPASDAGSAGASAERVLVTGANGHVGRRLIRRLLSAEWRRSVRAVVRSEASAQVLRSLPEPLRPEIQIVDYRDEDAVVRAAEGCSRIVHLVGILKESPSTRYSEAHETSSTAVARAAEKNGLRGIVYLSILGSRPDSPNECLASKGRAEQILLERGVPATILRVPMVLGPGELAARALRARASARRVALVRGGASLEQPIDAEDLVAGIQAALDDPQPSDRALDLGGPESLSYRELLQRAAGVLQRPPPRVIPVPLALARLFAGLADRLLSNPPLTPAMLGVLDHDDRVDPAPACAALGLELTPLDETLKRSLPESRSGT